MSFLHAPCAAIRAFRQSVSYSSTEESTAYAYMEIGRLYANLGAHESAVFYLKKAQNLHSELEGLQDWLEFLTDSEGDPPVYVMGDLEWTASEALIADYPEKVLQLTRGREGTLTHQVRASAQALKGDCDAFMEEWRAIEQLKDPIELRYSDFFFLPKKLKDDARFWELLHGVKYRFTENGVTLVNSASYSTVGAKGTERHWENYLKFQLARCRNDEVELRELAKIYPEWPELQSLVKVC